MTTATRTTPQQLARVSAQLTDRDWEVLATLARIRLACTRQLERLLFTGGTPLANARGCRRTLAKLEREHLVARLERRVGGVRAGSAGYIWSLGVVGQHLLTRTGPGGGRELRRPWTPSLAFVSHRLAITELHVQLVEATRSGPDELVRFDAEPDCWRRYTGRHGGPVILKPDAYVLTAHGDYEDAWFVEVDRATESPQALTRKCRAYVAYYRTGREEAHHGVFPLVVFVVPHGRRETVVRDVVRRLKPAEHVLFRVMLAEDAPTMLFGGAA